MNLIKERRQHGAVCPVCKHPDYTITASDMGKEFKPNITCTKCGRSWTSGYDGGVYAELYKGEETK